MTIERLTNTTRDFIFNTNILDGLRNW